MDCHWEKLSVLGPIYGLVGQDLSDRDIANKLNLTEVTVHGCISWLLHSTKCHTRAELVLYASAARQRAWSLRVA
jgi:DNA-binding NarL/FixJ family response regulator